MLHELTHELWLTWNKTHSTHMTLQTATTKSANGHFEQQNTGSIYATPRSTNHQPPCTHAGDMVNSLMQELTSKEMEYIVDWVRVRQKLIQLLFCFL